MIIRRMRAFAKRAPADRALLAHACVLHAALVILCRIIAFGPLARALARMYRPRAAAGPTMDAGAEARCVWAAGTAASLFPVGATCLTAALTAQCLLRRAGGDPELRFGVRTGAPISAHAWLESDGRALAGLPAGEGYAALDRHRI